MIMNATTTTTTTKFRENATSAKKFECKNMSCHDAAAAVVVDKDFAVVVAKLAFLYLSLKTSERK